MPSINSEQDYTAVDTASFAEDLFVELFQEAFGLDKVQYLVNEYPCQNIYGDNCYIGYALKTEIAAYAIEIDGETWHNLALVSVDKYLDDLLKRNSLTHLGWKVFIWTYRQLVNERKKFKSELVQFLGHNPHFRAFYEQRADSGLPIEKQNAGINRVKEMSDFDIARLMLTMPFEEFERKFFLEHRKDLNKVAFVPALWKRLTEEDKMELIEICERQIKVYYESKVDAII